jgi:hypothetical protein
MAEFRDFTIDDLFFIKLRDYERELFRDSKDCVLQLVNQAKASEAHTCIYKGEILFFYMLKEENGVATISLVASEEADKHPIPFARASKIELEAIAKKYRRVQATVHVDYIKSIKWLQRLDFKLEGILNKYGPDGADYYMMARTI